jgi:hypothetical protein
MTKHHLSRYSTSQQKDINLFRLRLQVTTLALPWQAYHSTKELQSTHFYTKAIATLHAPPLSDVPGNLIKFKVGFKKKTTSKANARYLPGNFVRQLEEKVEEFTKSDDAENFIGSLKFKEAKTQADPRIAYRAAKGLTDAIMSADSDFAAYLETDGLCLKDWHYNARGLHSCRGCFCQQVNGLLPLKLMLCWSAISDEFARNDLVNNLHVEFINIFDMGYRCIVAALSTQNCLQPSLLKAIKDTATMKSYIREQLRQPGPATRSGNDPSDMQNSRG